jgi:hypothetical protein
MQIFDQMHNDRDSVVYKIQKQFQRIFGFTLPLFHGRGLLNCIHILPGFVGLRADHRFF